MFDFVSAEYSAIGCILIDARCLPVVREHIPAPAAFTLEPCQRTYQAACTLADEGKPIDPVTVGRTAGLEREFLVQCMEIVPSCDGASQYAAAVAEGYRRRQLDGDPRQPDPGPADQLRDVSWPDDLADAGAGVDV